MIILLLVFSVTGCYNIITNGFYGQDCKGENEI